MAWIELRSFQRRQYAPLPIIGSGCGPRKQPNEQVSVSKLGVDPRRRKPSQPRSFIKCSDNCPAIAYPHHTTCGMDVP
jgi:hypothetical protein